MAGGHCDIDGWTSHSLKYHTCIHIQFSNFMHRSRFRHDVYMQWMRPSLRFSHFHQYLLQGIVRDSAITERAIEFKLQKYFSLHLMARKWTFLNTNIGILLFNPWSIACGRTLTAYMYAHNQAIVLHRLLPGHIFQTFPRFFPGIIIYGGTEMLYFHSK